MYSKNGGIGDTRDSRENYMYDPSSNINIPHHRGSTLLCFAPLRPSQCQTSQTHNCHSTGDYLKCLVACK
ncbi:hypothetical protein BDP81DRAFT_434977 [Colletotrichum phormii]|uniref:Uncharacterized protein n=1 Tax=Colletotrichum phormii TaxID=359342 RepID=A0AAI9ZLP1_9PEZI|nr:uncharacterized protein BDP81DRAFT_434977 [Colletotrichum phormii]KAK1625569.1 hypothetical protein BDP81DRAFT_434977 [Colletotrichum phormii]